MSSRSLAVAFLALLSFRSPVLGQPARPAGPVGDADPLPALEAVGPTAAVTALAFSPDSRTLYSAGYDKVVRVWRRAADGGPFQPDSRSTFRVPIGPGRDGVINVLAVSPDGAWLAVSGLGVYRGGSGFGQPGWVVPDETLTPQMRQERSLIYLFNTQSRAVALLRGHEEDVLGLAFAPQREGQPQALVSVGRKAGTTTGRVCVWDTSKAATLNEQGELADRGAKLHDWQVTDIGAVPGEPPPGLAVRTTPEGNVRVATAWGDGKLRVREFGPAGPVAMSEAVDEPRNTNGRPAEFTQVVAAAAGRLLTGGFVAGKGYVKSWDDRPGQAPQPGDGLYLNPPGGVSYTLPRAMALVSSGRGNLDHAAMVLRSPARQGVGFEYRLALLDLNRFQLVERPDQDSLLGTWARPPVVASSPDGQFLAVTGDQGREVRVFAAADLFIRRSGPTVLRGVGASIASVAFVRKGQSAELGLVMRPSGGFAPGPIQALAPTDMILDAGQRRLTPIPAGQGWRMVSPIEAGWRADRDANLPNVFHWVGPQGRGTTTLKLQSTQVVTAVAIVPPRQPITEPVLAVATWDSKVGEPLLGIYRTTNGQQLRQYSGHVQPVLSLAATPDGRLLASAAEDQTVCLWSLTDLGDILARHATLSGISFRQGEGSLVVSKVEAGTPAAGALAADDVIESLLFAGPERKPRPVATPLDFFRAVWDERPGEAVRINVRRGANLSVSVMLEQGVDERKPLVSLFTTRDRVPEWIAWTPLGPYDASGREAERYLGWHFNPSKPGEPVRFANADAYRERMHKPGLIKSILARGNLTDALKDLEVRESVPRPTLAFAIDGTDPIRSVEGAEQVLVRQPRVTLRIRVLGPSLDKNEVESVTWRVNDGAPRAIPLDAAAGDTLTQVMELGSRGVYRVQVSVRTREREPQEVPRDLVVRFQPPAPKLRVEGMAETRQTVQNPQFKLKAAVEPGAPGQQVAVTLRHGSGEPQAKGMNVDETVTLTPGENVLELRAANAGALAGYEEFESDRRTVVVNFQPVNAPQLLISSVVPVVPTGAPIEVEPGRPLTVGAGKVRVRGVIKATQPLTVAQLGDKPLTGFRANAAAEFAVDEEVTLKPGEQDLRFRAKTANSPEADARLTVVHRPALPIVTLTDPDPDRSLTEGRDAREVDLRGVVTPPEGLPPAGLYAYQAIVRVTNNGKAVPQGDGQETITLASERLAPAGALAAKLRLEPGDNRIDVLVRNRWQEGQTVERHVFYRRPPRFVGEVTAAPPGEKPFTDVVAEIESASDLTHVECNGREYAVAEVAEKVKESVWRVKVPQVSLVTGQNMVRLLVSNRDGPALAEGRAMVAYAPPAPKPRPTVELVNKPQGAVKEPQFMARFAVRSTGSPIARIELRQDSTVLKSVTDLKQDQDGKDLFTAAGEIGPVTLREGPNRLRLVAINGGGESEEAFAVSHLPIPEWLEIDQPKGALQQAEYQLNGRVRWTGANRAPEVQRRLQKLRVYVNSGFQQQTPTYGTVGANQVDFSVKIILNRPKDNLVEVICPDLRPEAGGQQRFKVDCAKPQEEPRTLHLLVVAVTPGRVDATDKVLALRALKALKAKGAGAAGLKSDVFQTVLMHPYAKDQPTQVVSGYVTCEHVRDALESIRRHSKPNDVALIYWLGQEALNENGDLFLLTSESRPGRKLAHSAISLREILAFPQDVPGACALLLDTANSSTPEKAPAALTVESNRVAVLRYAWSGKAVQVPGLLSALEDSSETREVTSLQSLAAAAEASSRKHPGAPRLDGNLKDLPAMAELVLSRRPGG